MLKVVVLCAQDELDPLGRRVCAQGGQRKLGGGGGEGGEEEGDESVENGVSVLLTVSGGFPAIVLGLVGAPLLLLAVVPVPPVAVPPLALPAQRDVDADVHRPVA